MTTYKLTGEGYVIKDGTTKVPTTDTPQFPNTNQDFLAYKAWLQAGGVPLPAEPAPAEVPEEISRAQGKAALIQAGMWDAVQAFVASIPDPTQRALADVALNDTQTWERSSPFLNTATAGLGLSKSQLDSLFIQGGAITF